MKALFDNLVISSPNMGGIFLISDSRVVQLDNIDSTGLCKAAGVFLRGLQPSSLLICRDQTFEVIDGVNIYDDIHDVFCHKNYIYLVCTKRNEIIELDQSGEAIRKWTFDGEDDSHHINCLGVWNDRVIFSAFGDFKKAREYKGKSSGAGYVQDLLSGKRLITDLSQPHSLVACGHNLLIANSEETEIREYTPSGDVVRVRKLDGYTRGICVSPEAIYVGLSASRNVSEQGVPSATLVALDCDTWDEIGRLPLPVNEIYSIISIDDVRELLNVVATIASHSSLTVIEQENEINNLSEQVADLSVQVVDFKSVSLERDIAIEAIREIKQSLSWRLTMPLRFASRLYR